MHNTKYLRDLAIAFSLLKTEPEIVYFLKSLLTDEELHKIPRRLQIVKMLKSGMTQREIASKLGVSITTVTHGSIEIQKGHFKNIK